jgi:hypothetical protein
MAVAGGTGPGGVRRRWTRTIMAVAMTASSMAKWDVIDHFARTGNCTHQWTTLRNLAHLLRQLGDHEPATLLDAAADQAPDAPAIGPTPTPTATKAPPSPPQAPPRPPAISRAHALAVAQEAIERNLPGP